VFHFFFCLCGGARLFSIEKRISGHSRRLVMNEYRIVGRLTSGSFGSVFKCVRKSDGAVFVLKRVPLASVGQDTRDSSLMEVELMKQLHHPHVVAYRDSFMFNQTDLCIVMDYYKGGDLGDAIRKATDERKAFTEHTVMHWFVQMALALHYLHSHRIVHRDLKTQNVFLNAERGELAVGDFGVAQVPSGETAAAAGPSTGTPLYMAPEVLQGHPSTFKSDVWSLGCILYELMALRHPFHASDISGLVIKVMRGEYSPVPPMYDGRIARLVDQMLERDPRRRPLIDEILSTPLLRGFLGSYAAVRAPRGPPQSSDEMIIRKQLHAFGAPAGVVSNSRATLEPSPSRPHATPQRQRLDGQGHQWSEAQRDASPSVSPSHYAVTQSSGVSSSRLTLANAQPPPHLTQVPLSNQSNVEDMRTKTLREIEAEVVRLRQLVGEQPGVLVSPQPRRQGHPSYFYPLPENAVRGLSTSPQPDGLQTSPAVLSTSNPVTSPARRSNLTEVQHRNKLHRTCVTALGAKTYGQIYAYYSAVPTQLRDPQRVVNMVQDRSLWAILPMVDEVVQLDNSWDRPLPQHQQQAVH
jgi:serine/threonine protein kinase